jgi:hypothetical protein
VELADLKAKAIGARSFSAAVGPPDAPRTIHLRTPTQHELRLASLRAGVGGMSDAAAMAVLERALLVLSVVGWAGVACADLAPVQSGADDAAEFEPGATELLLDTHPEWGEQLWLVLVEHITERGQRREAAAKN